jgi:hypothetical protein
MLDPVELAQRDEILRTLADMARKGLGVPPVVGRLDSTRLVASVNTFGQGRTPQRLPGERCLARRVRGVRRTDLPTSGAQEADPHAPRAA